MAMDGLVTGQFYARKAIARQLARAGQTKEADLERGKPVTVKPALQKTVVQAALSDGREIIEELERKCRDILREAVTVKAASGVEPDWKAVGKQARAVLMDALEPAKAGELRFQQAGGVSARTLEKYRRDRRNRAIWKRQQKELADWRAGRRNEPVWRLKARQQTTRMRTGWTRWFNQGQIKRAQENEEVAYLLFTLGAAANHTEICLNRAGMILNKNSPRLQEHRPPLHWGCKSKLVPITRAEAKANGWKQTIPKGLTGDAKPDPGFMVGATRQGGRS